MQLAVYCINVATISHSSGEPAFGTNQLEQDACEIVKRMSCGCDWPHCDAPLGAQQSEWEAANQNFVGGGKKKLKVDGNAKMQNLVECLSFDGVDAKNLWETHFLASASVST